MDHHRCVSPRDTRVVADGFDASDGGGCDGGLFDWRADHRVYDAVRVSRLAGLSVGTISDGIARAWPFFGESFGRIFAGVIAPFTMAAHTGSPSIYFGTMVVMVLIGACLPLAFGRETLGNLETFTEALPELA